MKPAVPAACLLVAAAALAAAHAPGPAQADDPTARRPLVREVWIDERRGDVLIDLEDRTQNLTGFRGDHTVRDVQVCPDGRHALVWHHGEYPPLEVTTVRIADGKRIASFCPGFGGELRWTPDDNIVHWWGVSTGVWTVQIRSISGVLVLEAGGSGVAVSPGARWVATFPLQAVDGDIRVYETGRGRLVHLDVPGERFSVDRADWSGDANLHLRYTTFDEAGPTGTHHLRLALTPR